MKKKSAIGKTDICSIGQSLALVSSSIRNVDVQDGWD